MLSIDDYKRFVSDRRLCVLSAVTAEGYPHGAAMHYSFEPDSGRYYFSTDRRSKKFGATLRSNSGSIVVGWSENDWITVQAVGRLEAVAADELLSAQTVHYRANPQSAEFKDDPNAAFLALAPSWIRYSDLGVGPEAIWEWSENGRR